MGDLSPEIQKVSRTWIPLARGPFVYRVALLDGEFKPGVTDEEIISWAQKDMHRHDNVGALALSKVDAALIIQSSRPNSDGKTHPTTRYYPDGLNEFAWPIVFPSGVDPLHARNYLAMVISAWNWMVSEFSNAVVSGKCKVFARVGSDRAPFSELPPDLFGRLKIKRWGDGINGISEAYGQDGAAYFSLYVAQGDCDKLESTMRDETNCQRWLESLMRKSPDKKTMTKRVAKREWRKKHPIADNAFNRAWSGAAKTTNALKWIAAGAPRGKKK